MKKLERIFWEKDCFVDSKGKMLNPIPILEPFSMKLYLDEKDAHKQVEKFVNADYCFEDLNINAYSMGIATTNDRGLPIQFYKI